MNGRQTVQIALHLLALCKDSLLLQIFPINDCALCLIT